MSSISRGFGPARRSGIATAVLISALVLGACSSDGSKAGNSSGNPERSVTVERPKVTIVTKDFSFDAPATIPAGYVDVTVKNDGAEGHQVQFVKLNAVTETEFTTAAGGTSIGDIGDAVFVGGPNGAGPGASTTATVKLEPGKYGIACFIPAADGVAHAAKGMVGFVTVEKTDASVFRAPKSDGTIVLGDFVFEPPKNFNGRGTFAVENQGNQVHEMAYFKIAEGKTLDDVKAYILTPPGTPPPPGPPPFAEGGGIVGLSHGQENWLDFDLAAGDYAMFCFFPDPTKGDLPHAIEGMIKEFTVT